LISHVVRDVISPQIKQHGESYHDYLKDISATAGLLLGGTVALWSVESISLVKSFAVLGFFFLSITVLFSFYLRKERVVRPMPYILSLRKLSRWLTDHSNEIVLFSRKEISIDDYKKDKTEFESKYSNMRESLRFSDLEKNEENEMERMPKWYSEINLVSLFFLLGIVLILTSVLLPQICAI
jgi:hypothetical protein